MWDLREATASQKVPLGRFLDSTDGDTEEIGLTIADTDIKLFKTGATALANKNSGGATHMANGEYNAVLDATDTNTRGPMKVTVHAAGARVVELYCRVLSATMYDQLYGSGALGVNIIQVDGSATGVDGFGRAIESITSGAATGTPTTTSVPTTGLSPAATVQDQFKGQILCFDKATTTTALRGQKTTITASTAGGTLTVDALTTAPVSGDTFTIQ